MLLHWFNDIQIIRNSLSSESSSTVYWQRLMDFFGISHGTGLSEEYYVLFAIIKVLSYLSYPGILLTLQAASFRGPICNFWVSQVYKKIWGCSPEVEFLVLLCRCFQPEALRPEPWPRVALPLSSPILLYVSQHRTLTATGQKKAFSNSLVSSRDAHNRDIEKSHLLNIWTTGAMDRTSG